MMAHRPPRAMPRQGEPRHPVLPPSVRDNVRAYAARLGRHHLRAPVGADDRDGHRRARPPDPARRRDRARRRLRHGRRDPPAARPPAGRARHRGRRRAVHGRGGARRSCPPRSTSAAPICSSSSSRRRWTRSSRPRRSTGSPTTSGSSRACAPRSPRAGGSSRSAAATATSRRSSRRASTSPARRPTPSTSTAGRPTGSSRRPQDTERRLRAAGFTDVWCWLSRVDVDPGDPRRLPARDLPRLVPAPAARGAARAVRGRRARAPPRPAGDPLRAAEHPGSNVTSPKAKARNERLAWQAKRVLSWRAESRGRARAAVSHVAPPVPRPSRAPSGRRQAG